MANACRFIYIHWRNSGNPTTQKRLFGFHAKKKLRSGYRDEVPKKELLKNIVWTQRELKRPHSKKLPSLQILIDQKNGSDNEVLQRVMMHTVYELVVCKPSKGVSPLPVASYICHHSICHVLLAGFLANWHDEAVWGKGSQKNTNYDHLSTHKISYMFKLQTQFQWWQYWSRFFFSGTC